MEGIIEVPSFFLCPISLQIMRDPVILPTGITYDRHAIERWIFTENHPTCPITNQPLPSDNNDSLITPNVTLRRLIQAWCITNGASQGIERFPTPRPPVTKAYISDLINNISSTTSSPLIITTSLRKLKSIMSESERNKRCVQESTEAINFLASLIIVGSSSTNDDEEEEEEVIDEALHLLYSLQLKEEGVARLFEAKPQFVESLTAVLQRSNYQCRAYAILLLKSLFMVTCHSKMLSLKEELLVQVVKVLKDRISYQATKAALQVLGIVTSFAKNKVKAVEAGAVQVLIDLLLDEMDKKSCEMMLVVLSRLSDCPEGRAEIVGHAAGIAVVSKKLVRFSVAASERAVKIMHAIAKFSSGSSRVLKEMLEVGVVSKLCLLVQVDCGEKTKERAREMLRLHARVWRNSPCISRHLQSSYPSL